MPLLSAIYSDVICKLNITMTSSGTPLPKTRSSAFKYIHALIYNIQFKEGDATDCVNLRSRDTVEAGVGEPKHPRRDSSKLITRHVGSMHVQFADILMITRTFSSPPPPQSQFPFEYQPAFRTYHDNQPNYCATAGASLKALASLASSPRLPARPRTPLSAKHARRGPSRTRSTKARAKRGQSASPATKNRNQALPPRTEAVLRAAQGSPSTTLRANSAKRATSAARASTLARHADQTPTLCASRAKSAQQARSKTRNATQNRTKHRHARIASPLAALAKGQASLIATRARYPSTLRRQITTK